MRPTQRSVPARQPNKSFDAGRRDDTLLSTKMIKIFPRNAVIERVMFTAEISSLWYAAWKPVMQNISGVVVRLLYSVKFAILLSFSQLVSWGINIPVLCYSRTVFEFMACQEAFFQRSPAPLFRGSWHKSSTFSARMKVVKGEELILFWNTYLL